MSRPDITLNVTYENSANSIRLQVCDLMMGAAGYYGNKFHLRRPNGKGNDCQAKLKLEMAKYIYETIKYIDAQTRGSKAFNWFESTGISGDSTNHFCP